MPAAGDDGRNADAADPLAQRPVPHIKEVPRQRNRIFALTLASIAAFVFLTVLILTVLFHYYQSHYGVAGF